ncbi:MAG: glycosyltransferase family 2 protein [Lachnospiraceae bacterium]|nr:glycosyltransferase family 2 protein [Lachnospiraceae bacterium]
MIKVSVVIPNYNGSKFIKPCLNNLKEQSFTDFEVIVVDNGSTDGSPDMVREICPDAVIIGLDKNYGFSKAVNEGIRAARAPFVFLLNNDTEVDRDCIKQLYLRITSDEKIFSVSSRMLKMSDPDMIDSAGDLYCCLGWAFARGKDKKKEKYDSPAEVFSACAGAALYRKSVFNVIGYFDEKHFAYLEDVDIGYRAKICGYRNVYEPKALVLHAGSGMSGSRYNEFKVVLSAGNSLYVPYKNMPFLQLLINLPFLMIGIMIKAGFFIRKGLGKAYFKGLARGIKLCFNGKKFAYNSRYIMNYIRIQGLLYINTVKRFKD